MMTSLFKALLFFGLIAGLALGANILADLGGGIRIAALGYEFTLGPLQSLLVVLLIFALVWIILRILALLSAVISFLNGDETALSRYFDRNRERKGYQALSDALIALASGDGHLALSRAQRAEKYLARPELTNLIAAQSAEMAGNPSRAAEAYKALLSDERTRFIGVRGLMLQKLAEGDQATAMKLAEKALALKPRHPEIQDLLLQMQTDQADWKGARKTLESQAKSGSLPKDIYRRRDAVLALQEAKGVLEEGASVEAREAAILANRLSPDLVPAAALAARGLAQKGEIKAATKVLKKAWEVHPHPDLAAAFAALEPDETADARLKRFKTLTALRPHDPETQLLLTELLLATEDFPAARRALAPLLDKNPDQRALALMAAIERGQGAEEEVVRGWLARAVSAPRGPAWCCDKCQSVHSEWGPVCRQCSGFDTLSWRSPTTDPSLHANSALLPLLVSPPGASETQPVPNTNILSAKPQPGKDE